MIAFCLRRPSRAQVRLTCIALAIGLSFVSESFAREPGRGVDAFVQQVLARNPALGGRALRRAAARSEAAAAGLWPDPTAAVMLDRVPERSEGEMPMVQYQLSQMIPWPGKLGLMQSAAERRADAAHADAKSLRLDLVRDAKRGYWMLLLNAGLRDINRAGRGLLDTIAGAALGRYGAGSGGHHDVVRAQVEQNAIEVEALDLEGERIALLAMLNALRDMPAATAIAEPVEPELGAQSLTNDLAQLERTAAESRPELERMRAMRREEEAMAALARRERHPDLMTSIWYNQMLGEPDTAGVMLGITLPIFNLRRQNRLAQASDLRAESAGSDLRSMQAMIRFEIADAARKLGTAQRTLDFVRDTASPRANQSFVASLAGYSTGSVDMVGVLEAWRSLQAIERARIEAVAARLSALADLERAIGRPLAEVSP